SLFQIILGTQVREDMDMVIVQLGYDLRSQWISNLGIDFYIHRSFSFLLAGVNIWLYLRIRRFESIFGLYSRLGSYIMLTIILTVVTGVIMAYWGVPA